eukprot:gene26542-34265_t
MLDVRLGRGDSIKAALLLLTGNGEITLIEDDQWDLKLPPESNRNWISCDLCLKWRRVPWFVDTEKYKSEVFLTCGMCDWDLFKTNGCEDPQDEFD